MLSLSSARKLPSAHQKHAQHNPRQPGIPPEPYTTRTTPHSIGNGDSATDKRRMQLPIEIALLTTFNKPESEVAGAQATQQSGKLSAATPCGCLYWNELAYVGTKRAAEPTFPLISYTRKKGLQTRSSDAWMSASRGPYCSCSR